jgi:hypothetical protein
MYKDLSRGVGQNFLHVRVVQRRLYCVVKMMSGLHVLYSKRQIVLVKYVWNIRECREVAGLKLDA